MKSYLGLVVVALSTIGCAAEEPDTSEKAQELRGICPDPEDCTLSNGGGGYTQEVGNAHIGSAAKDLMITHFINQSGGGVILEGREFDPVAGNYFKQTSQAISARWDNVVYPVFGVYEQDTVPQFRLSRNDGTTFNVTGAGLLSLELILPIKPDVWTISFRAGVNHGDDTVLPHGPGVDQLTPGPGSQAVQLHAFDMFWNTGTTRSANPEPYCHLAKKLVANPPAPLSDPVVFQQGISVNAVTVDMAVNMNNYVTLSCLHGAIATARWWGYSYRGTPAETEMFEAAMHMKRASYCGDDAFYTRRGVVIMIKDNVGNLSNPLFDPLEFEASWGRAWLPNGPIRAKCINKAKVRRPMAAYPPIPNAQNGGPVFDGWCNGVELPDCGTGAYGSLASQAAP